MVSDSEPKERAAGATLAGFQKRALRGQAHGLSPIAFVGADGPTDAVVAALDQALTDHELVKVRMHQPDDKKAIARALAEGTNAALCGLVGHTAILYRPHPEKPRIKLPTRPAKAGAPGA